MTKNKETQRGITLVALVITIVILIILATISIGAIFGDNGLINRAQDAKNYQANADAEQNQFFGDAETAINEALGGKGESTGEKTLVQAFKDGEIKVGDYVNYKPEAHNPITVGTSETGYTNSKSMSEGTDQTFTQDQNTTWRVLGLSEDGNHLLLTSGSPIKKDGEDPYLVLESAAGAANCVKVLDKISGLYHNSALADETRSIKIEDIERALGDMTVEYPQEDESGTGKVYFTDDESKAQIGITTEYPSYTYQEGDYKLVNPPVQATAGEKVSADAWAFMYANPGNGTKMEYVPQRVYDMLFADTTGSANLAKSYWLASPGVYAASDDAFFGPGAVYLGIASSGNGDLFGSDGYWDAYGCAVRPVVSLKSNVSVKQVQKIDDQTESKWSTTGGQEYGSGNLDDEGEPN